MWSETRALFNPPAKGTSAIRKRSAGAVSGSRSRWWNAAVNAARFMSPKVNAKTRHPILVRQSPHLAKFEREPTSSVRNPSQWIGSAVLIYPSSHGVTICTMRRGIYQRVVAVCSRQEPFNPCNVDQPLPGHLLIFLVGYPCSTRPNSEAPDPILLSSSVNPEGQGRQEDGRSDKSHAPLLLLGARAAISRAGSSSSSRSITESCESLVAEPYATSCHERESCAIGAAYWMIGLPDPYTTRAGSDCRARPSFVLGCRPCLASTRQGRFQITLLRHNSPGKRADQPTKPTIRFTSAMIGAAMAPAFSAPALRMRSISAVSASRRRISAAIGVSLATASSASAFLKPENCWPPYRASTAATGSSASAA